MFATKNKKIINYILKELKILFKSKVYYVICFITFIIKDIPNVLEGATFKNIKQLKSILKI